jgi:single-strand DNA-binding protein
MNSVTISGRLTGEPDLRHTAEERAFCTMRVAVDNGRHPTTYIDAVAFDAQAYACAEYLAKGRKIGVEGRLALREWREAGGPTRRRYSVIGRVEFLDPPPRAAAEEMPIGPAADVPEAARAEEPEAVLAA